MKTIIMAALISTVVAVPALAADQKLSVGGGYGFGNGGVISVHGDYDISDMAKAPVKARIGWDHYTLDYGSGSFNYSWSYNVYYGGAYYDFSSLIKLGDKIHPFAGLGFGFGQVSCSGTYCSGYSSPTVGGFYYIGGVQYNVTSNIDAEVSLSQWSGFAVGANLKF